MKHNECNVSSGTSMLRHTPTQYASRGRQCGRSSCLCLCFQSMDVFIRASLVKLTIKYERKQGHEEKDPVCISPGEWLNESEEASDREWREAALLALRVTGPSRTGGCEHTQRNIDINILTVILSKLSALLGSHHLELRNQTLYKQK